MRIDKLIRFLYTFTYFVSLVPLRMYDFIHRTEYGGIDIDGDRDGRFAYFPSSFFSFPRLGRYIKDSMSGGRGHAVIDIGCGKGLVLNFFGRFSFERISGIEYDGGLCRLARRNLRDYPGTIKVYHGDAANFLQYEYYDTFYLYNPFNEAIMEKWLDRIMLSLAEYPRELTVFYCNPVYTDALIRRGFRERGHFYYKTTVFVFPLTE